MPYKERLYPWVLVRLLPKMQRLTVGQFRTRSPADGRLRDSPPLGSWREIRGDI